MQAELGKELERSAQLKTQSNADKLAQTLAAKHAAKAKELETTVTAGVLLQDYQVQQLLATRVRSWLHMFAACNHADRMCNV